MKKEAQFLSSVAELAPNYDAFIIDLWGVIHDGINLYPKVKECLQAIRKTQKKMVLLSNAPRRASAAQANLERLGITHDLYDAIVTSGETAYQCLAHPESSFFKPKGKHYFYIGLEKDRSVLQGLHYEEVEHPEFAQFVLLAHSYVDNQPLAELIPLLKECAEHKLPLLCINPDLEVVRIDGTHVYCAGRLAEEYRMMGGEVIYFGKPHRAVYEASLHALGALTKPRILAIGDGLRTDILGANKTGLDSALVTGGVLSKTLGKLPVKEQNAECRQLFAKEDITPTFVVPAFNW